MAYTPEYVLADAMPIVTDVTMTGMVAIKPFMVPLIQIGIVSLLLGLFGAILLAVFGFIKIPSKIGRA